MDNGRVEVAGFPMIAQPSGVLVANWHLSLLHVTWFWVWARMQSLPMRRMVGHSLLVGNLGAKWERPGIEETSSGVGTSCVRLGNG